MSALVNPFKLKTPEPSDDFERCPIGNHLGIVCAIIDLGTHDEAFKSKVNRTHSLFIGWEIPHETMANGKPFVIGQKFTLSMHEKAKLRIMIEGWRNRRFAVGEEFELAVLMAKPCSVNYVEEEKGGKHYRNIASVSAVPKGTPIPKMTYEPALYYVSPDHPIPEWPHLPRIFGEEIRDIIESSYEYRGLNPETAISNGHAPTGSPAMAPASSSAPDGEDSDIPF